MNGAPPGRDRRRAAWLGLAVIGVGMLLVVVYLAAETPGALAGQGDRVRLVYLLLLLVLLGSGALVRWRGRPGLVLRHALIWGAVGLVLVAGYGFRYEARGLWQRITGEILPHRGIETAPGEITFRIGRGGQFHVQALVDGTSVRFLVDTGATLVVLSPADARRIGFDLSRLSFSQRFNTANGTGLGAPVRLREVRAGSITLRDVRASVNRAEMDTSLLGMSFLGRLSGYEVKNGALTLRR